MRVQFSPLSLKERNHVQVAQRCEADQEAAAVIPQGKEGRQAGEEAWNANRAIGRALI